MIAMKELLHYGTVTGHVNRSLGQVINTGASDPEQREAFIQHLVAIGQKASPATEEYLARQVNSQVCQDALRILREKGLV